MQYFTFQKQKSVAEFYQIFANNNKNTLLKLEVIVFFEVIYREENGLTIINRIDFLTKKDNTTGETGNCNMLPSEFVDQSIIFDRDSIKDEIYYHENCAPEDFVEKTHFYFKRRIQQITDATDKYQIAFEKLYQKHFTSKIK